MWPVTTYHHGDLRAAVLAAAGALIEKEGLASLSIREAARRAGVSHNAPYRHFPDRDALLAALAADGFDALEKFLQGKAGRALGEAYVRFALEHPQRFRLMFMKGEPRATYERFAAAFAGSGAEAGVGAAAAWSLIHGLACLILDGHLKNDEDFVRRVLGAVRLAVAQRSA
jgi:AcrR family transcriptional regulator